MQLKAVKAIITGAASGLGYHFTLQLARAGASVAACDVNTKGLDRLREESEGLEGRVITAKLDVTQESSVVTFVNDVDKQLSGINTLVNNAGILRDGLLAREEAGWTRKLPTTLWRQVIDVNLTGSYLLAREATASMLKRKQSDGLIVNISSVSSMGNAGQSNYAASKAGLDACTRTWALELSPHGIRVCGIAPGLVDTPILDEVSEEAKASLIASIPLGRIARPEEVWLALKFVIECDYFTGRIVEVDGGLKF
jgi:3-oxoacyl-[acyl-carrier protein] reductase